MSLRKITDYVDLIDPSEEEAKIGDFIMAETEKGTHIFYEYGKKINEQIINRVFIMRPKTKEFTWDMADACWQFDNIEDTKKIVFDYEELSSLIEKRNNLRKTHKYGQPTDALSEAEDAVINCLKINSKD